MPLPSTTTEDGGQDKLSDRPQASGHTRLEFLRGLRERLREPRRYEWPEYLTAGFGVGEQLACVDFGDGPDCEHEECNQDFWEDPDYDPAEIAHIIAISKGQHPANGVRDDDEQLGNFFGFGRDDGHRAMGLPKEQRKRWKLHDRRDGTIRRGLSILGGDLAGPRLSWGSERGPTLDAGQGGAGSVRMGPEVHGGPVARLGDGPDVWIVKP